VERIFPDEHEELYKYGRGFFYTKTDVGLELRHDIEGIKNHIYNKYYLTYHQKFKKIVDDKIKKYENVSIIDCQSFSAANFNTDINKNPKMPDKCIGINSHTPKYLCRIFCSRNGYQKVSQEDEKKTGKNLEMD